MLPFAKFPSPEVPDWIYVFLDSLLGHACLIPVIIATTSGMKWYKYNQQIYG